MNEDYNEIKYTTSETGELMLKCPECGQELPLKQYRKCPVCGAKLKGNPSNIMSTIIVAALALSIIIGVCTLIKDISTKPRIIEDRGDYGFTEQTEEIEEPEYPEIEGFTKEDIDNLPKGQREALLKAAYKVSYRNFSKKELEEDLVYYGFSREDARFAVENCGADWFDHAVAKAESYIELLTLSKDMLISQLTFDGFSDEQIEHALNNTSFNWKENAAKTAERYIGYGMSTEEILKSLKVEKFTQEEIDYAVESLGLK